MKVLHFILGRASATTSNGVNKVINGLAKYGNRSDEIIVFGISKKSKKGQAYVERDGFRVEYYNALSRDAFERFKFLAKNCDIVHLHSVWNLYNIRIASFLIKEKIPYVITPHSGLYEDRIRQSNRIKKLLFHKFFQRRIFEKANGIHAITKEEKTAILRYVSNKNIFYVPNGLDLEALDSLGLTKKSSINNSDTFNFCYLGRLSVEKNILSLIKAVKGLNDDNKGNFNCYLVGPNDSSYALSLANIVRELEIEDNVIFVGALYGIKKYEFLKSMDFYVHPAFSDVVSIAVKEALYCGLPCVITRTSDVSYYYNSNSFVMTEPDEISIKNGIQDMVELRSQWKTMSNNGQRLVRSLFNWEQIAPKMMKEYLKVLDEHTS